MKKMFISLLVMVALVLVLFIQNTSAITSDVGALIGSKLNQRAAIIGGAIGGIIGFVGGAAIGNLLFPGPGTLLGLKGASWGAGIGTILVGA
jgi:hypothetical protein